MKFLFSCLFAFSGTLFAQSSDKATSVYAPDPDIKQECKLFLFGGLNLFYNNEYVEADAKFDDYSRCDSQSPIGEWRKMYNQYFALRFSQGMETPRVDSGTYERFMALSEEGFRKAQAKVIAGESIDFYRYVMADIRSIEAVMVSHNDGYARYFKARSLINDAMELATMSHYQDAQYILGFVNYKASSAPRLAKPFFPHDRCEGIELLAAAERGNMNIFSDDIRLVMVSIAMGAHADILKKCGGYHPPAFDQLAVRYPGNVLLHEYFRKGLP